MAFQTDNTLITNREMLTELAAVAGHALMAPARLALEMVRRSFSRH